MSGSPESPEGRPAPAVREEPPGVWALAWPTMTLFSLHALVGVVDFVFVSSLGTEAVAAVGVASHIHFFSFAVLAAVTTGTVAVVARETGRGDHDEAARATRCSVVLVSLFSGLAMLAIPFGAELVGLMGVTPEVSELGGSCLGILLLFNVPFAVSVALSQAIRAAGDARTPLLIGVLENVVNIVADYALIFGRLGAPELGARGSAWASGLAFSAGFLAVWWLWRRGGLVIPPGSWRGSLSRRLSWRLLRVGLPTAAEQGAFQGGLLLFMAIVSRFGTEAVSAYLIGARVLAFCFIPGMGFALAASTLVGQHLGGERPDLAARAGWRGMGGAVGVMGCVGLVIVVFVRPLVGLFGSVGEETAELAVIFIYILGAAQPFMAVEFALAGALRGAGDTRFPLFSLLAGLFVVRLAAALWIALPVFGTVTAVWCCLLLDYSLKAGLLTWRFASGRWKTVRV